MPARLEMTAVPLLAAAALIALSGCSDRAETPAPAPAESTAPVAATSPTDAAATQNPAQQAYAKANAAMHAGMTDIPADADEAFMRGMLAHHRGALAMSEVALKYGKDAQARDLAQRIMAAQQREIDEMEAWLAKRGAATPAAGAAAPVDHAAMGH